MSPHPPKFVTWFDSLTARHTADLTFQELRRSLTALSHIYTQDRRRLAAGAALDGRGKRAAFALHYAPMHYLLVAQAAAQAGLTAPPRWADLTLDLGCGTGVGAAAWAGMQAGQGAKEPRVMGVDSSAWALTEARWNWQQLGLRGEARRAALGTQGLAALPPATSYVAAYVVNELTGDVRAAMLEALLCAHAERGAALLVVEPIARSLTPWWPAWREAILAAGGQEHELRQRPRLPAKMALLGRTAGLDHHELTARSLSLAWGTPVTLSTMRFSCPQGCRP